MSTKNFAWLPKNSVFNPGVFAGFLNRGKIDVGGQVLFAGIRQQVVGDVVPEISARSVPLVRAGENISSAVKP